MQTLKLRYETDGEGRETILAHVRQYSSCLRFSYNRVLEGLGEREVRERVSGMDNVGLVDSWTAHSAFKEAVQLSKVNRHVVFGGKGNFIRRCKGLATREEFEANRLSPFYCIGDAEHHGNRKFRISEDLHAVVFQPSKWVRVELRLAFGDRKGILKVLGRLRQIQESCESPVTFRLGPGHVYVTFDEKEVFGVRRSRQIPGRVMAIDMNPNFMGWSVVDWKSSSDYRVVAHGVFDFRKLNDRDWRLKGQHVPSDDPRRKAISNKRRFEAIEVAKSLVAKAKAYECETFAVEDLSFRPGGAGRGRNSNRLCRNMWVRSGFVSNLEKRCGLCGIWFRAVPAQYSSFIGNVLYGKYGTPDMVNASIEVGRRAAEFRRQYVDRTSSKRGDVVYPARSRIADAMPKSTEEAGVAEVPSDWKGLLSLYKNLGLMYRVPLRGDERWFQLNSRHSDVGFTETGCPSPSSWN